MWLQKIDLIGFKSFAHATTLEFLPPTAESRGITAIVGPNGSGKSCVVDAIRWVLGEQSMKLLRGKKSEDVIFAGTPKRPRLGVAEVTLHLNNEDGSAGIDYTEVAIGRRVYRSGESEYLLNGTKVRREDILLLLAAGRVGQRTYSIIGQGMVDQFLLASPTERKTFFDEAAGIRPAEIKRDHAVAKLASAEENLRQGEVLLQEITPRLRSLTRQVKRLERREEVERELRDLHIQSFGARWHELRASVDHARATWGTADAERSRLHAAVEEIQSRLSALEREEHRGDAFLGLQREYEMLVDRRQELRERLLVLRSARAHATTSANVPLAAAALVGDLDAVLSEFDEFLTTLRMVHRLDDLQPTVERLQAIHTRIAAVRKRCAPDAPAEPAPELTAAADALRGVEGKLADVQRRMNALHEEERRKKGTFFELQRQYREQQLALNEVTSRANDLRIELARLEQRREDLRVEIARDLGASAEADALPIPTAPLAPDAADRIARLSREIALIGMLDEQTMQEYRDAQERAAFLEHQTTDLRKSITALEGIIGELEQEIDRAFHVAFTTINAHFERYFRQLFGGGHATLALLREQPAADEDGDAHEDIKIPDIPPTDRLTPHASRLTTQVSGIDITATPPGKRIKHVGMLSGGERALVAIALLCAIISSSQSPFVVLDEVDAALDESNSVRFAEILKDLARSTQFLVVTHNRYTMDRAAMIYGVTMGDEGASRILSLKLEDAERVAA
ncbi:AAA family ATPase [Candidatus Uhrbacteria bacterium]|nr:AAA family ATPase [Candidatus Uhrbacteria bacterium]